MEAETKKQVTHASAAASTRASRTLSRPARRADPPLRSRRVAGDHAEGPDRAHPRRPRGLARIRILQSVASGDPIPALAELSQWCGLVAAAESDEAVAVNWFRAAVRFNPAWSPDRKLASPLVRRLFKDAKREATEMGRLRVDVEPDDAQVRVDGKGIHAAGEKIDLEVGWHLVIVSSPTRAP